MADMFRKIGELIRSRQSTNCLCPFSPERTTELTAILATHRAVVRHQLNSFHIGRAAQSHAADLWKQIKLAEPATQGNSFALLLSVFAATLRSLRNNSEAGHRDRWRQNETVPRSEADNLRDAALLRVRDLYARGRVAALELNPAVIEPAKAIVDHLLGLEHVIDDDADEEHRDREIATVLAAFADYYWASIGGPR